MGGPTADSAHERGCVNEFSTTDLRKYDGIQSPEILIAFKGYVYDVSCRADLYGPAQRGAYSALAGQDATRALTKMSLKPEDVGRSDVEDLFESAQGDLHRKAMSDWAKRFNESYSCVGVLVEEEAGMPWASWTWPSWLSWRRSSQAIHPLPDEAKRMLEQDGEASSTSSSSPAGRGPGIGKSHTSSAAPPPPRRPPSLELLCKKPRLYLVRAFFSPDECRELRKMIGASSGRGMLFSAAKIREGLKVDGEHWSADQRELLRSAEERLGSLMGCSPHADEVELVGTLTPPLSDSSSEQVRCHLGLHVDTNGGRPWRYATAVCYLSSVTDGGGTVFPLARTVSDEEAGPPCEEDVEALEAAQRLLDAGIDHTDRVLVNGEQSTMRSEVEVLVQASQAGRGLTVRAEEGSIAVFWTRRNDGSIDPYSWHGGEVVNGAAKWTLQKFKEVPEEQRSENALLADFVSRTRQPLQL